MSLSFFLCLAFDEVDDIGMVDIKNDHLGSATGLAAGFDYTGEGVETFHEAEWSAGGAAAAQLFGRGTQRREIGSSSRTPLEEHALGLCQGENGIKRIVHGVDEAG